MLDFVHVDEKWFYLTKVKRRYYVYDDEEVAAHSVKSKHYITKVMFLAAVARPRYDHHSKTFWDGKVGVWPFVQVSPALRGSKNRPKGTLVTVPQAVDSTVYFDAVLNKVVPAITAKFPGGVRRGNVFIQQGNASPHRCVTTELLQAKGVRGIVVANQPPNSPDFNHQKATRSIEELIGAVESAFYELPADTVAKTFITLQKVLEMSIECMEAMITNFLMLQADFASYTMLSSMHLATRVR
ncbi:hypothetical protein AaE_012376 [Aphanomyces astaci]|uniref:Tc1-like transposase DDE domain-containing protein n=1 Tax=Aphanomyces astaci TaxID=112090 RepID=A0A6A4ZBG0_APHAT|nr:hypothetical protein AaE_012376 [Aphanomyces astaci]